MGAFAREVADVAGILARAAAEQGGVISGDNPTVYMPSDPLRIWVIEIVIIVAMIQLLSLGLSRIRQPRVIAEVIGGIILGPTVMGRIPGFKDTIFPDAAMPLLNLTSTIGLILFLFIVGLEVDTRLIKRNFKSSASISIAGLVLPLGLGAALGVGLYREFVDPSINFGYFVLFTAVAIGITAFPVLCRILTDLKLLETTVGVVVLAAGVGNDVVGWILLALSVALVNASNGLTALWVLLASVGFVIVLLYPGRLAYVWLARRTGSLEQGTPTTLMMTVTLLLVFICAFFTDIIGVHAIFGGFLAGFMVPHENGFAISLVEKFEDLVSILFLPIYFVLSGLRTNLGALNNGITWGYTILICLVAFTSKFFACYAAARATGFNWREAGAIGSLMSCKGLVELIVLNVGLSAGILDVRTFSMFVVHALVLTVMTTPLTLLFYPPKYRTRDGAPNIVKEAPSVEEGSSHRPVGDNEIRTKFALVLDKIEQLPAAMTLSQLLQSGASSTASPSSVSSSVDIKLEHVQERPAHPIPLESDQRLIARHSALVPRITINALRLIELTNRTSAVIRSTEAESLLYNDPIVSVFRTFGYLNRLLVSAALSVVSYDEFPAAIAKHVTDSGSHMVLLPWSRGATSISEEGGQTTPHNPFDGIFHKTTTQDQTSSVVYSEYIRNIFLNVPADIALFVDRGIGGQLPGSGGQHIFMPFFGGPDDRLALTFLVQLCANPSVTATITIAAADTVYGQPNTQTRLASETADNILWGRFTTPSDSHTPGIIAALPRMSFSTRRSARPLHTLTDMANGEIATASAEKNLIFSLGAPAAWLLKLISERGSPIGSTVPKTLGSVGAALVATNTSASLLILQASNV
ncbi:Sodium/hydrogen exchanger family-domain-containing protein [Infundibulicybe gibba]|nr:Sodium/hydrogen exchanger family-domain-containing protein [Infundibulicybe gibba]